LWGVLDPDRPAPWGGGGPLNTVVVGKSHSRGNQTKKKNHEGKQMGKTPNKRKEASPARCSLFKRGKGVTGKQVTGTKSKARVPAGGVLKKRKKEFLEKEHRNKMLAD